MKRTNTSPQRGGARAKTLLLRQEPCHCGTNDPNIPYEHTLGDHGIQDGKIMHRSTKRKG